MVFHFNRTIWFIQLLIAVVLDIIIIVPLLLWPNMFVLTLIVFIYLMWHTWLIMREPYMAEIDSENNLVVTGIRYCITIKAEDIVGVRLTRGLSLEYRHGYLYFSDASWYNKTLWHFILNIYRISPKIRQPDMFINYFMNIYKKK